MNIWKRSLLLSYISVASASAAIITPALPQIQSHWSLSHGALEWIVSLFLVGYMLGQCFYGPLANRLGRLKALRVGFSINLIGVAICLFSSYNASYEGLLIGRIITALGASAGLSCTFTLINESLSSEQAKHTLAFATVSFTAGIGLAVFIGGILTHYWQWQDCFWVLLAHGLLMLLSTALFTETLTVTHKVSPWVLAKQYCLVMRNRTLVTFSLFVGLVSVFCYCYSAAAPLIAQNTLGLSASEYGYWNLINMIGMLLGAVVAARLLRRYDNVKILLLSTIILLIFIGLLAMLGHYHSLNAIRFFSITAGLYLLSSLMFPAASHIASNASTDKANASGAMNLINMGSAVLAVAIMGYLPMTALTALVLVIGVFAGLCLTVKCLMLK